MEIVQGREIEIEEKRMFLDGVIFKDKCPSCKSDIELDLGTDDYLSYPTANKNFNHEVHCCKCNYDYTREFKLGITLDIDFDNHVEYKG